MNDQKYLDKEIYRVFISAPVETVWSELVNAANPRPFFWNGSWDTPDFSPGNPYRISANNGKAVPVIGRILEMDPPHKLVTTFRLTNLPDPASIVTYLLEEKDGGTDFQLITENVLAGSKSEKSMASGSKFIVENFKAYVETGKVTFQARMMLAMLSIMAPVTPKSMSAENWPFDKAE
ncbi:SRPBCC domain-containing protein [Hyphococcus sp.]|uniref:SRPBCC domain-containing protein n=1 Tax=Hyphococcus sp. TaxID=2038636 RepID=UPI003CCBCFDE